MRLIYPRNKGVFFSVVLVLLVILIILTKMAFSPKENLPTKTATTPTPKIVDLCVPFPADKGEASCEEAKKIALAQYPGELLSIDKTTLPYQPGKTTETKTEQRKVWLIEIKPNNPSSLPSVPKSPDDKELQIIESIKVAVDRNTKAILFFEPAFKK